MCVNRDKAKKTAELYYIQGMSKTKIAEQEHMTRQTVCETLDYAVSTGIVKIRVGQNEEELWFKEQWLKRFFGLHECFLTRDVYEREQTENAIVQTVVEHFNDGRLPGSVLGVDGLEITDRFVDAFLHKSKRPGYLVQVTGRQDPVERTRRTKTENKTDIVKIPYQLEVDSLEDLAVYYQSSLMKRVCNLWKQLDAVIFSVDRCRETFWQYHGNRECLEQIDHLKANRYKSVGRFLGRCVDIEGNIVDRERNSRVLSIDLEMLSSVKHRILLAHEDHNIFLVTGILRTGIVTDLYADERTADLLMKISALV